MVTTKKERWHISKAEGLSREGFDRLESLGVRFDSRGRQQAAARTMLALMAAGAAVAPPKRMFKKKGQWTRRGGATWNDRAAIVDWLGFESYGGYLKSDLWRGIRRRVLHRDEYECCICGGDANQVHHLNYSLACLAGRQDTLLISVCRQCHEELSVGENGKVRTVGEMRLYLCDKLGFNVTSSFRYGKAVLRYRKKAAKS